jgi:hypothetical protein
MSFTAAAFICLQAYLAFTEAEVNQWNATLIQLNFKIRNLFPCGSAKHEIYSN